jgi:hypothetical protein
MAHYEETVIPTTSTIRIRNYGQYSTVVFDAYLRIMKQFIKGYYAEIEGRHIKYFQLKYVVFFFCPLLKFIIDTTSVQESMIQLRQEKEHKLMIPT